MEQIFKALKLILIILMIISCNSKKDESTDNIFDKSIDKNKILSYNFPDTVKLNKVIDGKLQYDINNISFDSSIISSRFLELILSTDINKELANYDEIDDNRLLSYVDSLAIGKFNFKAVFEKKGKQTLNIAIRDYMYLKPNKNTPPDKMTLRTSDCLFSKDVYVVE